MGCRPLPYWVGTFAFDYILFYAFVIIFIMFSYALGLDFITDYMGTVVFIFTTLGLSIVSFSYMIGLLLFTKTSTAMKTFPIFNFFIVYSMPWCIWGILVLIRTKNNLDWMDYLIGGWEIISTIISPYYTFNMAF